MSPTVLYVPGMSSVVDGSPAGQQTPHERRYELFTMLDSDNLKTVEETKLIIHENLYTCRDPSLVNALVEYYVETHSSAALQILVNIHEARSHVSGEFLSVLCDFILIRFAGANICLEFMILFVYCSSCSRR